MVSTTNVEQLFEWACSGNIGALNEYWLKEYNLDVIYKRFGKEHSLIMGAFRNQQYNTVKWLKNHGCRLTNEEQDKINMEYIKIKKLLASNSIKSE